MTIDGRPMYWKLDGHTPVPATSVEFGAQFEKPEVRRVAYDEIGAVNVSTVFLGLDHSFRLQGPPLLFETMIFGLDDENEYQWRYSTWDEAEAGHARALAAVREGRDPYAEAE
jgi:hypothetical protein